jgi:hypothetical protein
MVNNGLCGSNPAVSLTSLPRGAERRRLANEMDLRRLALTSFP